MKKEKHGTQTINEDTFCLSTFLGHTGTDLLQQKEIFFGRESIIESVTDDLMREICVATIEPNKRNGLAYNNQSCSRSLLQVRTACYI